MLASKTLGALSFVDPAWNVANAEFLGANQNSFYVGGQDGFTQDIFIKPDGTKMYIVGSSGDSVYEYNLSTAWDISTATFAQLFSVAAQDTVSTGLFFKPDGTKMYIVGQSDDDVNEYNLSTAWDISTAVFLQLFSVATQETTPKGLFFKPDGTKMYVVGIVSDTIHEYNLSTAWDISTTSFLQSFSISAQDLTPSGLFFKSDGLKIYVVGDSGNDINEYNLSVAWDISTAVYLQVFSVAAQDPAPQGVFFKDDGTVMYIVGESNDTVFQYQLSTAWDISTATFSMPTTKYFSVATQELSPNGLSFKSDGTKMYAAGDNSGCVNEYDLSSAWAVSTATYLQRFLISTPDSNPSGLFFKPDGTKMYTTGFANDSVYEYTLSTAWNISTAVYVQALSVTAKETQPSGAVFKSDGTKMYVVGITSDNVHEYDLSTAWNISTAVFLQSFSVASQESNPRNVFFKPDGTKMYIVGTTGDDVNEYTLSTAWNISTATFVRLFSFVPQTLNPTGIFFRETGLQMYVISLTSDAIWEYDLV